jgi:hypothetical protein
MNTVEKILLALFAILMITVGYIIGERFAPRPPAKVVQLPAPPPVVIYRDTVIYYRDTAVVYRTRPIPVPVPEVSNLVAYSDSIINDSTHIVINDTIRGELVSREVKVRPVVVVRTETITQEVPYMVENPPVLPFTLSIGAVGGRDVFGAQVALNYRNSYIAGQYTNLGPAIVVGRTFNLNKKR